MMLSLSLRSPDSLFQMKLENKNQADCTKIKGDSAAAKFCAAVTKYLSIKYRGLVSSPSLIDQTSYNQMATVHVSMNNLRWWAKGDVP